MIKENDKVITLVEKANFPVGSIGIVVSVYSDNKACEVEIWDEDEYPTDVITFLLSEIKLVSDC